MIGATPLEANAAKQIIAWVVELLNQVVANWEQVSNALALALAVYLLVTIYQRFEDRTDPSFRMQSDTAAGSVSVLISGVAVTGVLLLVIAFLTWPLVIEDTFVASAMLAVFGTHYYVEQQEVS